MEAKELAKIEEAEKKAKEDKKEKSKVRCSVQTAPK